MRLSIALGIAAAALTVAAASAQSSHRIVINRGGSAINIDANEDGWVTRAEASSAYERIFADLDSNHDGKLDDADRARHRERHADASEHVRVLGDRNGRQVRVITRDDMDDETEARIEAEIDEAMSRADAEVERAERQSERAERDAERAERQAERAAERAERHVRRIHTDGDRQVIIIRTNGDDDTSWTTLEGDEVAPVPPVPPVPPIPPVPAMPFMMLIANSEEADRDGNGSLSREEFVAQHLRFFDASDANGDGRVRFEPPTPPTPPAPPAPPEPPRRR